MSKKLLIGLMLIIALSGCGKKEEKEIKEEKKYICNEIKEYITKYESNDISFKDFKSVVSSMDKSSTNSCK